MNLTAVSLTVTSIIGIIALVTSVLSSLATNRKLKAEAGHLSTSNITIYADAARNLLEPLNQQLRTTQDECDRLRTKVQELTRTVAEQQLLVDELTEKLTDATRSASWYRAEFERVTRPPRGKT